MPARFRRWPTLTQMDSHIHGRGTTIGWLFPATAVTLEPLSTIFLRLIKSLCRAVVFSTLVVGVAGHGGDIKSVGRLALRAIIYFEAVTTLALVVGLLAGNLAHPGTGVSLAEAPAAPGAELAAHHVSLSAVIVHMVPQSIVEAASTNDVPAGRRIRDPLRDRAERECPTSRAPRCWDCSRAWPRSCSAWSAS